MAARWKHLKIFKLMRKLLPPLSHDKRWCKVCSWWVLIHSCVYISLILFCFQTHYWSIDQAIRRDKNWMLPALTILNALSSCLADADSSVPPNLWDKPPLFFFLMLSVVCSILNFILVNRLGETDHPGWHQWLLLVLSIHGPMVQRAGICICWETENFGLLLNDEYRRIPFFLAPSNPLT